MDRKNDSIQRLKKKYADGKHWHHHPEKYANVFSRFLKARRVSGLVLDIGCGNGRDCRIFRDKGFSVLGIDVSGEELRLARKQNPGIRFSRQDAQSLELEDCSVAAIHAINIIHYLDREKAMKEFMRVLEPGGHMFIHFNLEIKDSRGNVDYSDDRRTIRKLVSASGFRILKERDVRRLDHKPVEHTHRILELILQKPRKR